MVETNKVLDERINTYKRAIENCRNSQFGGRCYEMCGFRENGCCELSEHEIVNTCLKRLLGNKYKPDDFNSFINQSVLGMLKLVDEYKNVDTINMPSIKKPVKALVSGSYDPFTQGHLTIVKQAAEIFDEVHVVIFVNSNKKRHYDAELMVEAIKETIENEGITNCVVGYDSGLLADYCKKNDIKYNVRGLRNNMDYNYEENISEVNKLINDEIKTMYVQAESKISSSTVRELVAYNIDVSKFVPEPVRNKFNFCQKE